MATMANNPITLDKLLHASKTLMKLKTETDSEYVRRLTHAALTECGITRITNLGECRKLLSLYLYGNRIRKIENLQPCKQLTHLYLQHNQIERLENLQALTNLTKLYVGFNKIAVVEGLDRLSNLKELHIENQELEPGEKLVFDPRSVRSLASSLRVLNVAGNGLDDLDDLAPFYELVSFNASNNHIAELAHILLIVENNQQLTRLWVRGNAICDIPKWREEIISSSYSLAAIDGGEISATTRQFLMNWKQAIQRRRAEATQPRQPRQPKPRPVPGQAKFPSKFSAGNPHWLPPLPPKVRRAAPAAEPHDDPGAFY